MGKETGTKKEVRPGVWRLRVSVGRDPVTGKYPQVTKTVSAERGRPPMTEKQAAKELAKLVAEVEGGEHDVSVTFAAALRQWLELGADGWERNTLDGYTDDAEREIIPHEVRIGGRNVRLGDVPVTELTGEMFERFYDDLAKGRSASGRKLSPRSIQKVHATARACLNRAVFWRWIPYNPCVGARRPPVRRAEKRLPSPEQFRAMATAVGKSDPELAVMLWVCLLLGGRRSEICGLRWADIAPNEITIRTAVVKVKGKPGEAENRYGPRGVPARETIIKDPKSHAVRVVAIDQATAVLLQQFRARVDERAHEAGTSIAPDGFLFSHRANCSAPIEPDALSRGYKRAAKAAGIEGTSLKSLRAMSVSLQLSQGVPLVEVSRTAGHAKLSTTVDFYAEFIPGHEKQGPDVLRGLLGSPEIGAA